MGTGEQPDPAARAGRWTTLAVLSLGSFAVFANSLLVGPLLVELSQGLGVGLATAGQLVTVYALPAAAMALLSGPLLDRFGRRPVLLAALTLVAAATAGSALAGDFATLVALRLLAGVGGASLWPATLAAVGDLFPYRERATAIGVVSSVNMLAPVVGVPAVALVADALGWRAAFAGVAALLLLADLAVLARLPGRPPGPPATRASRAALRPAVYLEVLRHPEALALVAFGLLSHVYWHGFLTYAGSFYQTSYGLRVGELAPILSAAGLAVGAGSLVGGPVAGRLGGRRVAVVALLVVAALLPAQLALSLPLSAAFALHLAWSLPNGARGPGASALLTEVYPARRGTVISLSSASSSLGTLLGASLSGVAIASAGFAGLGVLCAGFALLSAAVLHLFVREVGDAPAVRR